MMMVRLSIDARHQAILLWQCGLKIKKIRERFKQEEIVVSGISLYLIVKKYAQTGQI